MLAHLNDVDAHGHEGESDEEQHEDDEHVLGVGRSDVACANRQLRSFLLFIRNFLRDSHATNYRPPHGRVASSA